MWFGNVTAGDTIQIPWDVVSLQSGSVTPTTAGSIRIYKGSSTTERTSANGITDTRTFDSVTGQNIVVIDLSDNTDAGFYAAGNNYHVMLVGAVVEGLTINKWLASFSIQNRNDYADVREWIGTAVATPTTAGVPEVDVTHVSGTAQTAGDIIADTSDIQSRLPATLVSGRIDASVGAMAANTLTASALAADAVAEIADGVWDEDATGHQTGGTFGQAIGDPAADTTTIYQAVVTGAAGTHIAADIIAVKAETAAIVDDTGTSGVVLANDAITAAKIATGAIDADAIAADAITAAKVAADVTTEIQNGLATAASIAALNNLGQADIRAAVGLTSANLDTQLTAIDDYLDTEVAAIKAKTDLIPGTADGLTWSARELLCSSALLGKVSGAATATVVFRSLDDSKDRITATVDADGNRTAVTRDAT